MRDEDLIEGMRQAMPQTTPKKLDERILAQARQELRNQHFRWKRWVAAAAILLLATLIWAPWAESPSMLESKHLSLADGGEVRPLGDCVLDESEWPGRLIVHQGRIRASVKGAPIHLASKLGPVILSSGAMEMTVLKEGDSDMAAWRTRYKLGAGLGAGALLLGIQLFGSDAQAKVGTIELSGPGEHAFVVTAEGARQLVAAEADAVTQPVDTSPYVAEEESASLAGQGYGAQVIDAATKRPIAGATVGWQKPEVMVSLWEVTPGGGKSILGGVGDHRVPAHAALGKLLSETTTQKEGRFVLPEFPPVFSQLTIQAEGYAPVALRDAKRFVEGSRDDIIELYPAQWLELSVVDENLQPVEWQVNDILIVRLPLLGKARAWHEMRMTPDQRGRITIPLDRRELLRIEPLIEGYEKLEQSIQVSPGRNTHQLVLKLAPSVSGIVVDERGEAVEGAKLTIHSKKSLLFRTIKQRRVHLITDSSGRFRATVAGSDIEITVDADGYGLTRREDCKPGDHELQISLTKYVGGGVSGRLVDHTGRGIANARVLVHYSQRQMEEFPEVRTDEGGRFSFEGLSPGALRIVYSRSVQAPSPNQHQIFFDIESDPVEVIDEQMVAVPDIVVPIGGTIEGVAVRRTGLASYLSVELFRVTSLRMGQPRPLAFIRPSEKGEFSIRGVPAGNYGLMLLGGSEVKLLSVKEGVTTNVRLGGARCELKLAIQREGAAIGRADVSLAQIGGKLTDARITSTDDSGRLNESAMTSGTWFFRVEERATGELFFGQLELTENSALQTIQWPTHEMRIDFPENRTEEGRLTVSCKTLGNTPLTGAIPAPYLKVKSSLIQPNTQQVSLKGMARGEYEVVFTLAGETTRRIVHVGSGIARVSLP